MGLAAAASAAMDAAADAAQRLRIPAVKARISWRQRRGDTLTMGETTEVTDVQLSSGHLKMYHWLRGVRKRSVPLAAGEDEWLPSVHEASHLAARRMAPSRIETPQ